jgi:hypothetical protein
MNYGQAPDLDGIADVPRELPGWKPAYSGRASNEI